MGKPSDDPALEPMSHSQGRILVLYKTEYKFLALSFGTRAKCTVSQEPSKLCG
jgi:hypothetical protein